MSPTLRHGDILAVWLRSSRRTPAIGRIVVVELTDRPLSVKRVAAVEPDGRVHVEGDNPFGSTDSRTLGALPSTAVQGVVLGRVWPRPRLLLSQRR
jgi:hypothetical protein